MTDWWLIDDWLMIDWWLINGNCIGLQVLWSTKGSQNFTSKTMNYVLKMMNFTFKMMNCWMKMQKQGPGTPAAYLRASEKPTLLSTTGSTISCVFHAFFMRFSCVFHAFFMRFDFRHRFASMFLQFDGIWRNLTEFSLEFSHVNYTYNIMYRMITSATLGSEVRGTWAEARCEVRGARCGSDGSNDAASWVTWDMAMCGRQSLPNCE